MREVILNRVSKYSLILLAVFSLSNMGHAQCANTNSLYLDLTPTGVGNTQSDACTFYGEYNTFTACLGAQYTITTCGSPLDSRITLYNNGTGAFILDQDADNCSGTDESVTWVSTINGVVRVLIDRWNCGHSATCGSMSVTQNTACAAAGNPGDDCANAIRIDCGDAATAGETTNGNGDSENTWSCTGIPTVGEDRYYVVNWPDATTGGEIRIQFTNVTDANDTYMEVFAVGSTCDGNCANSYQMTIATGLFGSGNTFIEYTVPAGVADYYFVVDGQNDFIDNFDIGVTCYSTGIELDVTNSCSPIPVTALANQGYYQTWNGAVPPDSISPTQHAAMIGNTYTICENVYLENPGWEWLMYFDVTLGSCWINVGNYSPNGNNTGFFATEWCTGSTNGASGAWTASLTAGVISWIYDHPKAHTGNCAPMNQYYPAWGDGNTNNYTCNLYTFCYDAEVDPTCSARFGFQNGVSATDDGVGGTGGAVSASNISLTTTSPTVLPISLLGFSAEPLEKDGKHAVMLNWTTSSETNNAFFTVQRSLDGIIFEDLKNIPGAGTTTDINRYYSIDEEPLNGTSYYRLKQTDFNGDSETFEIVAVNLAKITEVSVYPNPVNENLTISFNSRYTRPYVELKVYNVVGKVIYMETVNALKGSNQFKINTNEFVNGMYFITVGSGSGLQKAKFSKAK